MTPVYPPGSVAGEIEDTLRELIAEGVAERDAVSDRQELADIAGLVQRFTLADEGVLERQFRGWREHGDLGENLNAFVHLPAVRDTTPAMHPILSFAYDWPRGMVRFRVAMFLPVVSEEHPRQLRATGFRYEAPEAWAAGPDAEGMPEDDDPGGHHDMFHAQPVTRLCKSLSRTDLPGMRWINTSQPSIPVSAEDGAGLFLAMLVATYGRRRIVERFQERKLKALRRAAPQVSGLPDPPRPPPP